MKPKALALVAALAFISSAGAGELKFTFDPNKVSPLGDQKFDIKEASGFGGTAPGFDKDLDFPTSDWIHRDAVLGGREIYAPLVDMNRNYPTADLPLTGQLSAFSGQTAPFSSASLAPLPQQAALPHFDHLFEDKIYQGRDEDLIREAIDRLTSQSEAALAKQLGPRNGPSSPTMTVDQVKGLLNKDVTPLSTVAP